MLGVGYGCLATMSELKNRQLGESAGTARGLVSLWPQMTVKPGVYPPWTISLLVIVHTSKVQSTQCHLLTRGWISAAQPAGGDDIAMMKLERRSRCDNTNLHSLRHK